MKKNFLKFVLIAFVGMVMGVTFVSCSSDNNDNNNGGGTVTPQDWSKKKAKYTIMFYGCGGGDVDSQLESSFSGIVKSLNVPNNQVRFTVMYSMSKDDSKYRQANETTNYLGDWGVTYRYELSPSTDLTRSGYRSKYKYKNASEVYLNEPATIAEYIEWVKRTAPAENYILMPVNHGGGFDIDNESLPASRAICYDDNHDQEAVSCKAFAEALKQTNTHLKAVYWFGCLMGQLEVLNELAPHCDFQFCSSHVSRAIPHITYNIIRAINQSPDDFEKAAKIDETMFLSKDLDYGYNYLQYFQNIEDTKQKGVYHNENCDWGCWRSDKLAPINEQVKKMATLVTENYQTDKEAIDLVTKSVYSYEYDANYVDVLDYVSKLAVSLQGDKAEKAKQIAIDLAAALKAANVYRISGVQRYSADAQPICPVTNFFSLGISIYKKDAKDYINYGQVYKETAFDKATGWSKFFDMNTVSVFHSETNPCNNSSWELVNLLTE